MDALLDTVWEQIAGYMAFLAESFFSLLQNLHIFGPILLLFILALLTVCITKMLNRLIVTRRYLELEKNFHHWVKVREEAMSFEDPEKGKRMARNIDQAELNRAYYDYFFESLLLGLARKIIPIFFMFGFINEYYRPEKMVEYFGQAHVLQLGGASGSPTLVGSVFFYFLSLLCCYLLWAIGARFINKQKGKHLFKKPQLIGDTR